MKTSVKSFVVNHESILGPRRASIFHSVKESGFLRTLGVLQKFHKESGAPDDPTLIGFVATEPAVLMGNQILSELPSRVFQAYFPFSDLNIIPGLPRDTTVLVEIRSLCTAKTKYGTAYFSPYKPMLETKGGRAIVAFSDHAVRRICQRSVGSWETMLNLGYAFSVMHDTEYFEPWKSRQGNEGFVVYKRYASLRPEDSKVETILGERDPKKPYFYRLGYCPAALDGGFLRAKTLLLPGMRGTPEYEHVLRRLMTSHAKRTELERQVQNLGASKFEDPDYLDLMKRFHDSGIPQVVSFDHDIARCELGGLTICPPL